MIRVLDERRLIACWLPCRRLVVLYQGMTRRGGGIQRVRRIGREGVDVNASQHKLRPVGRIMVRHECGMWTTGVMFRDCRDGVRESRGE